MDPVQFYKCLADETRLRCLLLIEREGELCVCELTAALQEIQPKISRHLAQLKAFGLLADRRQGQWIFYRIDPNLPDWARQVLTLTSDNNKRFVSVIHKNLCDMDVRPEREINF